MILGAAPNWVARAARLALAATPMLAGPPTSLLAQTVTYHEHIAPIVADHCASCHTDGGGTPFTLESYRDVRRRARQIQTVTRARYMPPWLPVHGVGDFLGRRQLTSSELTRIAEWVAQGTPEGEAPTHPPRPSPSAAAFRPSPDFVLGGESSFKVPAEGLGRYHTLVFSLGDRPIPYLRGLELLPSDASTVHGAMFVADPSGLARTLDDETPEAGYPSVANVGTQLAGSLGGSAFGTPVPLLPAGYGWVVPPKSTIGVELHLNCIGREVPLRTGLAVYLPKEPVTHPVTSVAFGNLRIDIEPGAEDHRLTAEYVCPVDVEILGLFPQSYFICQGIEITAVEPDGKSQELLRIGDWDCAWMQSYFYRTPLRLNAGTLVRAEFRYDNSAANPQNPYSPPRRTVAGHFVDGELALVLLHLAPILPTDVARLEASHREGFAHRREQLRAWRDARHRPR